MLQNSKGVRFFSEGAEAPQAAATQPQRAWGGPEIVKQLQNPQDACSKIPGACVFFSEGFEAPQAAATQPQRAAGP